MEENKPGHTKSDIVLQSMFTPTLLRRLVFHSLPILPTAVIVWLDSVEPCPSIKFVSLGVCRRGVPWKLGSSLSAWSHSSVAPRPVQSSWGFTLWDGSILAFAFGFLVGLVSLEIVGGSLILWRSSSVGVVALG